jgi:hypothetical protein
VDTPVFATNKTGRHDITEILLKVTLNAITLTPSYIMEKQQHERLQWILDVPDYLPTIL